jgi:hypothetical protein
MAMGDRLKIGVSACFLHPDPARAALASKTLQYIEQSMPHWVMSGRRPAGDDSVAHRRHRARRRHFADYAQWLDGLVLHGGADVWPGSYGETPLQDPGMGGDRIRDEYEIALVQGLCQCRQAGVRHLPRPAADQRGLRRHAVPGHQHPAGPRAEVHRDARPTT